MKPFRFPLETLRQLRQQKEQEAQVRHAEALTARDQAAARLQQARADLSAGLNLLAGQLAQGVTADELVCTRAWCSILESHRNEQQAALETADQNAENSRQTLAASSRERETLDRFHDNSLRAHDQAVRREEQKQFDEIAVQRSEAARPLATKLN